MPSTRAEPFLLDDEQVRSYIANGYLRIDLPSVPAEVHEAIAVKLDRMLELGPNLGNNLLPHTPEFRHVLNSPEVRGALSSLLGPDYIEHPHRYCHDMAPFDEAPEDLAEAVGQRCHQDSYTPMSRPRQHYPRYARIIYYPRDTPVKHGPTHVTPGSQFHKTVTGEDRAGALPMEGPAGSLWITHFDVIHGAGINLSERTRHMIKFIYLRRSGLKGPAWKCQDLQWKNPEKPRGAVGSGGRLVAHVGLDVRQGVTAGTASGPPTATGTATARTWQRPWKGTGPPPRCWLPSTGQRPWARAPPGRCRPLSGCSTGGTRRCAPRPPTPWEPSASRRCRS